MDRNKFYGAFTALLTPFTSNGIDEASYRKFINWQIAQGIHGVVPCGTTGESPTLSEKEHERVVDICIETVAQRVPVIAGAGSNSTAEAVQMTKHAAKAGADAVLVVTGCVRERIHLKGWGGLGRAHVDSHLDALQDTILGAIFLIV